jgi:hypothetical protein
MDLSDAINRFNHRIIRVLYSKLCIHLCLEDILVSGDFYHFWSWVNLGASDDRFAPWLNLIDTGSMGIYEIHQTVAKERNSDFHLGEEELSGEVLVRF